MLDSIKRVSSCLVLTLVVLAAGFGPLGCGKQEEPEQKELIRPVKFFEVGHSGKGTAIEFSGKIKASQEVDMSFEVPGRIIEFPVTEGQRVSKGALLARLDPRDYQIRLDAARADLNAARADYERARELYENNTISRRDLDVARRNFEKARAGTDSAEKAVKDTRLTAPFEGLIARTLTDNFQNIQAKQAVLSIHDDTSLEMLVDIPEQDLTRLKTDTSAAKLNQTYHPEILVSSLPGRTFPAEFREASTVADPTTRTFEVTFGFEPPTDVTILPGMTARLRITEKSGPTDTIYIPAKAVFASPEKQSMVWKIDPSARQVTAVPVTVGNMAGADIRVNEGLAPGDLIAVSGVHQLRDGMTVREYQSK